MNTRIGGQKSVAAQKGFQIGTPLSYQARARVSFGRRMMTVRAEKVRCVVHYARYGLHERSGWKSLECSSRRFQKHRAIWLDSVFYASILVVYYYSISQ